MGHTLEGHRRHLWRTHVFQIGMPELILFRETSLMHQHVFNKLCILARINTNRGNLVMSLIYGMKLAVEIYWRIRGRITNTQPLLQSSATLTTSSGADKLRRMALCRELLLIWSLLGSFHFHPLTDGSQPAAGCFRGWIIVWRSFRSSLTSREAHTRRHFQNVHLLCDSFMHKNNKNSGKYGYIFCFFFLVAA